jgi:hypothetical protein
VSVRVVRCEIDKTNRETPIVRRSAAKLPKPEACAGRSALTCEYFEDCPDPPEMMACQCGPSQ